MKKALIGLCTLNMFLLLFGCSKQDRDFKDFFNDEEITYTGAVGTVFDRPGNYRTQLKWKSSSDPSITKYVIYWNSKQDSLTIPITTKTDSVTALITGLEEYSYSFVIFSYDAKGNKSIPREINNVKVYGSVYKNSLLNRAFDAEFPFISYSNDLTVLNFLPADTVNTHTLIRYENNKGQQIEKNVSATDKAVQLENYKLGSQITFNSSYMPVSGAIDTFSVNTFSVYPAYLNEMVECNKALFKENKLAKDVDNYGEAPLKNLWDGRREQEGWPNVYHTSGSQGYHTFTFDMGKEYFNLKEFEIIGRECCHNPIEFEVWGIDDLEDAATGLDPNDAGWKDESLALGWRLLADVTRTDDGREAKKFQIKASQVGTRYVRFRVKKTYTGEKDSNISEVTFWYGR